MKFLIIILIFLVSGLSAEQKLGPDSEYQKDVPKGKVTEYIHESKVFAGTKRKYYVYVPAQYKKEKPAAVMVFQDGHAYKNPKGQFRVPVVFDNLIHKGDTSC